MDTGKLSVKISILVLFAILAMVLPTISPVPRAGVTFAKQGSNEASFDVQIVYSGNGASPVKVLAPQRASVGEQVSLTLMSVGVQDLAGFQFRMSYEPQGVAYAGFQLNQELWNAGNSPFTLGPVRLKNSIWFGAATCPVSDCKSVNYQGSARSRGSIHGEVALAEVRFLVRQAGVQQLTLSEILLVDAEGKSLTSGRPAPELSREQADINGNTVVNDADASNIMAAWAEGLERGAGLYEAYQAYDLDSSGALDVVDIQAVLSRWGESTFASTPLPEANIQKSNAPEAGGVEYVVDSAADAGDADLGDMACVSTAGSCTLRAAVQQANVSYLPVNIHFNILDEGGVCPSLVTIPSAATIEVDNIDDQPVTIDGYTQCGAAPNMGAISGNAVIKIELKGTSTPGIRGIEVSSRNVTIRGLAIYDFDHQIYYNGSRAQNGLIVGNFAGTNAAQNRVTRVSGAESEGIRMNYGASNNQIGGPNPADRNIVSGNDQDGLTFQGLYTDNNKAFNNYIGLKQNGLSPLPNSADGVDIAEDATNTQLGGVNPGERNVIAGNTKDGVEISHGNSLREFTLVLGNFIGLAADGSALRPNGQKGITLEDLPARSLISRNIIVGNAQAGVRIYAAHGNQVVDNFIGVYPPGIGPGQVVPLPASVDLATLVTAPNGQDLSSTMSFGVFITAGSSSNEIRRNIIAFHPEYGIYINVNPGYLLYSCAADFNTISQNWIYSNGQQGIRFEETSTCPVDNQLYTPNQGIQPPTLDTPAAPTQVTGSTCANCRVEIFVADKASLGTGEDSGEGKTFIADGLAGAGGRFSIVFPALPAGTILTGTATDGLGNTSEFADNVIIQETGPVTPAPTTPVSTTPAPTTPAPATPVPTTPTPPGDENIYLPVIRN